MFEWLRTNSNSVDILKLYQNDIPLVINHSTENYLSFEMLGQKITNNVLYKGY